MAEELEMVTAERDALLRELEALEDREEKVECPGPVCAYSFVGEERAQQLVDHYVRDHCDLQSSRQAWAEEAMRLEMATEDALGILNDPFVQVPDLSGYARCACLPDDVVLPAPWTPPQCAVHPVSSSVLPDGEAQ